MVQSASTIGGFIPFATLQLCTPVTRGEPPAMRDDHKLRARSQLRDDNKLRDDHKLRVRSQLRDDNKLRDDQIACVDPNRDEFVIHLESLSQCDRTI